MALTDSDSLPEELSRESEILEQYIDVYVQQFLEGMDEKFIQEHSFIYSEDTEQVSSSEINQKWSHTSLNVAEDFESTDDV